MSIKTTITNNSMTSAVVGGKTLTRRTEGGQVIYDGFIDTSGGGGSGSDGGEQGTFAGYLRTHTLNVNSYYRTGSQVFETLNSDLNFDFFHNQAGNSTYYLLTSMVNRSSKRVYFTAGGAIPAFTYLEPLEGMLMVALASTLLELENSFGGSNAFPGYKYNGVNPIVGYGVGGVIRDYKHSGNYAWGQHGSSDFLNKMYIDGAPSYLFPGGLGPDSSVSHSAIANRDAHGIYQLTVA